jgi:hypothetical protein
MVSINGHLQGEGKIVITDLLGKVVQRSSMSLVDGTSQKKISLNSLAAGIYTVQVITSTKSVSQKLVVR